MNEYINQPIGTVFKETYEDGVCYYIVGNYFVYCNDYYCPQIRPWKFDTSLCEIASEDEKTKFIEALKNNHLIWNNKTGKVEREYEEVTLSVKVKVRPGMNMEELLDTLNKNIGNPVGVYEMKFEDF